MTNKIKDGMSRPPKRPNPSVDNDRAKKFEYTNINDIFDELETKTDPALDKSITVRQACLIALEQCKSIFEPDSIQWNKAIDAVVAALRSHAHDNK